MARIYFFSGSLPMARIYFFSKFFFSFFFFFYPIPKSESKPGPNHALPFAYVQETSGPSCSKLTTSLVNDSLKFKSSDTQIC